MRYPTIITFSLLACASVALTGCADTNDPEAFMGKRILFACDPHTSQEETNYIKTRLKAFSQSGEAVTLSINNNPYQNTQDTLQVSLDATPTFEYGRVRFSGPAKEASNAGIKDGQLHARFTVPGSSGFMSLRHTVNANLVLEPIDDGVLKVTNWELVATHHKTGAERYRDNIANSKVGDTLRARCFYPIES